MSKQNEFSPEDQLERSLAEMRREALPDGPPDDVVSKTLGALKRAEAEDTSAFGVRRSAFGEAANGSARELNAESREPIPLKQPQGNKQMRFLMKLAAVIALVSGVAAMLFIANQTNQVALGDVVKKLRDAHTMSCSATVAMPMNPQQPVTMKMYINQAFRMRIESEQGMVQIFDHAAGKILILSIPTKQATVATTGGGRQTTSDWIGAIKSIDTKGAQSLGEKEIDGQKAKGFLVKKEGSQFTFWADAESGAPITIEVEMPMAGKFMKVSLHDFVLDATLDDALFSLDPPEGYTVRKVDVAQTMAAWKKYSDEEHAIITLRTYAESSDGRFPSKLDDYTAYTKLATTKPIAPGELAPAMHGAMLMPFLMKVGKGNWAYSGDGVKLGEKDKLIFWYRDPKTTKYRGVYGDLTARELKDAEVPKSSTTPQ
jgi:outer membrane lipoprotein-sorting protein